MRWIVITAIITLISNTAAADPPELRLLPEYMPCEVAGVRYACYTADQQIVLNQLELQAEHWRQQVAIHNQLSLDMEQLITVLGEENDALRSSNSAFEARVESLLTQLEEEITAKNRYRAEAESTDVWPLVVGGTLGLVGVGVALGVLLGGLT